jgi:hypothetical protein
MKAKTITLMAVTSKIWWAIRIVSLHFYNGRWGSAPSFDKRTSNGWFPLHQCLAPQVRCSPNAWMAAMQGLENAFVSAW